MEKTSLKEVFLSLRELPERPYLCKNGCYFINNWSYVFGGEVLMHEDGDYKLTYGEEVVFKCPTGDLHFKEGAKDPRYINSVHYRDLENIKKSFEFLQECVEDVITIPF